MTNFQKWREYMAGIPSPDSYINFGFYYLISAALRRCVWCGPDHMKLHPNTYTVLVGEPGLGKGLVIKPVNEILRFHKLERPDGKVANGVQVKDELGDAVGEANYINATKRKSSAVEKPLLIPVGADSTTYEALVTATARATRGISYREWDNALQKHTSKAYLHCSIAFCLEEMSSLFRKKAEDTVNFIIKTYDCGDYEKDTKTQDHDIIKRSCLNFLAGTTPSFVERTFNDSILNDGFSSRVWFIVETANRFNTLTFPELTPTQQQYYQDIIEHVKKLSNIYGRVEFEPEAWEFLEDWWKNIHPYKKPNNSPKLIPYYSRKNIHVQKLAMAIHFGEDAATDENKKPLNKIKLITCQTALAMLDEVEPRMHGALSFDGNNPLAATGKKILRFLKHTGALTKKDIHANFWDDVNDAQLNEILEHLSKHTKIEMVTDAAGVKKWKLV